METLGADVCVEVVASVAKEVMRSLPWDGKGGRGVGPTFGGGGEILREDFVSPF